jgi:hypothetical protein
MPLKTERSKSQRSNLGLLFLKQYKERIINTVPGIMGTTYPITPRMKHNTPPTR